MKPTTKTMKTSSSSTVTMLRSPRRILSTVVPIAVIEMNSTFTDVIGFGPVGLPYAPTHPWWPDRESDPEGHQQVAEAFELLMEHSHGSYTIPVKHRDGHRLWVAAAFNQVVDPDTGRRVIVGTFRDVTAEHYAVQRESALAALSVGARISPHFIEPILGCRMRSRPPSG